MLFHGLGVQTNSCRHAEFISASFMLRRDPFKLPTDKLNSLFFWKAKPAVLRFR